VIAEAIVKDLGEAVVTWWSAVTHRPASLACGLFKSRHVVPFDLFERFPLFVPLHTVKLQDPRVECAHG
jgi:hypothetical protein